MISIEDLLFIYVSYLCFYSMVVVHIHPSTRMNTQLGVAIIIRPIFG